MQEIVGLTGFTSRPSSLQMACFAFLLSYHLQEHNTSVDILESSLGLDTVLRGNFDFVSVSSQPRLFLVLLLPWPRTWWSRGDFENPFFNAPLQMQPVRYICFKNMLKKKKKSAYEVLITISFACSCTIRLSQLKH